MKKDIINPLVVSEKQEGMHQGIDRPSLPFTMNDSGIGQATKPSPFSPKRGAFHFPFVPEGLALVEGAKIIFPFTALGTIFLGVYLLWKFFSY